MDVSEAEAVKTAWLLHCQAVDRLEECAELLRGAHIPASPEMMQIEIGVSKALDALKGNGFKR